MRPSRHQLAHSLARASEKFGQAHLIRQAIALGYDPELAYEYVLGPVDSSIHEAIDYINNKVASAMGLPAHLLSDCPPTHPNCRCAPSLGLASGEALAAGDVVAIDASGNLRSTKLEFATLALDAQVDYSVEVVYPKG